MNLKKKIIFILGLLISVVSIYWVINQIDLNLTKDIIFNIGFVNFLILALIYLLSFVPRGIRSKIMISSIKHIKFKVALFSVIIGYSFNAFMPFRIGELVRAYYLKSRTKISGLSCIGSIALERIFDSMVLLSFLFISFYFSGLKSSNNIFNIALNLFIFLIFFLIFSFLFFSFRYKLIEIIEKFFSSKLSRFTEKILNSFSFIHNSISLFKIIFYSFTIWSIEGLMYVFLAHTLNLPNPFIIGFFSLGIVSIGVLLPSSPGHIGVYEMSVILAFQLLGLDTSVGAAYALIIHFTQLFTILLMGLCISPSALKGLDVLNYIKK